MTYFDTDIKTLFLNILNDVRFHHFIILCSFLCAFGACFLTDDGWFEYDSRWVDLEYGTLNTISKSNQAGNFAFVCCIIATFFLLTAVVTLYLRISQSVSAEWLTPVATFSSLIGSMALFFGTLGYFIDFYIHFTRYCYTCDWSSIHPKIGVYLGLFGGFAGLISTRFLFVQQSKLGGLQVMPQRFNVIVLVGIMIVTICGSICAASTDKGWFFWSESFYEQADWGTQTYVYEVGDDYYWPVKDLPSSISKSGDFALVLSSLASGVCGLGLILFCSSFIHERFWVLEKVGFVLTFVGSTMLLVGTVQFKIEFDKGDDGYYQGDGYPYYAFYLGLLGGLEGMIMSSVALLYRFKVPRTAPELPTVPYAPIQEE